MKKILPLLICFFLIGCQQKPLDADYHIVFKNDKDGNALLGTKSDLIQFIRSGAPIKIGWGVKGARHSIEHLSEPIWIAILDESEVIAHLNAQVLSKTDWDGLSANYSDSTLLNQEWRVVITTKGEFDAVWYDRVNGKMINRRPQKHILTWFAKGTINESKPLFFHEGSDSVTKQAPPG